MNVIGTRVLWWRVQWMFARAIFTDNVVPRKVYARNWRRVHRATYKRVAR